MRLNLAKLEEWRKTAGTAGTAGTVNLYAASRVPSPFQPPGTVGTEEGGGPGSVPSVPTENSNIAPVPLHDPAAWAGDFHEWVMTHCVLRDRCFGGIGCLHVHFCEWASTESVPCTRETFEALLRMEDF
jgi:hypothetical protein